MLLRGNRKVSVKSNYEIIIRGSFNTTITQDNSKKIGNLIFIKPISPSNVKLKYSTR